MAENKAMADYKTVSVEAGNGGNNGMSAATSTISTDNDVDNGIFLSLTMDGSTVTPAAAFPAAAPEDVPRANSLPAEVVSRPEHRRAASADSPSSAVVAGEDVEEILVEPVIPMEFLEEAEIATEAVSPQESEQAASEPAPMELLCGTSENASEVAEKVPDKPRLQVACEGVGKTLTGPSNVSGSAKRKAVVSVSTSEKNSRVHGSHSDSENPISFGKPQKRGRRRRIISDDEEGEEERKLTDARLPAAVLSPGKQPGSPSGSDLPPTGRKTRSGKRLATADNTVVTLFDSSDDDLNLSFTDSSVTTIGESVIGWLNSIEQLCSKSKNLQGSISGRIKELIKKAKEGVSTMAARSVPFSDVAYLKMRNKELSCSLAAVEERNKRLMDKARAVQHPVRATTKDSEVQTLADFMYPPVKSQSISAHTVSFSLSPSPGRAASTFPSSFSPLPPPSSPRGSPVTGPVFPASVTAANPWQGEASKEFAQRVDKFAELKAEMMKQIEDMSNCVSKYTNVFNETLQGGGPKALKLLQPEKKALPKKVSAKPIMTSNKKLLVPFYEIVELPATFNSETATQWKTQVSRGIKRRKLKTNDISDEEKGIPSVKATVPAPKTPPSVKERTPRQPAPRRRVPKKAAVLINASSKEFSYANALKAAWEKISLREIGIDDRTTVRKAANGGTVIEISGPDGADKTDLLATKLSKILTDAQVRRPVAKGEIRLVGLDDSVGPEEIKYTLAEAGAVKVEMITTSEIRRMANGLGVAWASLPLEAATKVAEGGRIRLGWSSVRVELLQARPLQCYKCWQFGHLKYSCRSSTDRTNHCFRCGQAGHTAQTCSSAL